MTNYAVIDDRSAFLKEEFGEELARKWFGDERVDAMPRYVKGKNKGKLKGVVTWRKIVRGGWVKTWKEEGYVETRVGHIIERKLHELYSDQNGTGAGVCVFDLDLSIRQAEAKAVWIASVEEDLKKLNEELKELLETRPSVKEEHIYIFDSVIADHKTKIANLEKELV